MMLFGFMKEIDNIGITTLDIDMDYFQSEVLLNGDPTL